MLHVLNICLHLPLIYGWCRDQYSSSSMEYLGYTTCSSKDHSPEPDIFCWSHPPAILQTSSCKCLAVDQRHCAWSNEPAEFVKQVRTVKQLAHVSGEVTYKTSKSWDGCNILWWLLHCQIVPFLGDFAPKTLYHPKKIFCGHFKLALEKTCVEPLSC